MKKKLLTIICIAGSYVATAQTINIPDPIFEQALIDQEIDSDGIVNGQISTADALAATTISVGLFFPPGGYIEDLTGIEGFTNLESLTIAYTMIEELNVSSLTKLKYLDCANNLLSNIDLSNNSLLENLIIKVSDDVGPLNSINEVDLSNNPNIKNLIAQGIKYINLKNGNNNPDMHIDISVSYWGGPPPQIGHTCIEVDDAVAAQNNQLPYIAWTVLKYYWSYSLVADCSLSTKNFMKDTVSVYPNPASDVLHFDVKSESAIEKAVLFDISGRAVREYNEISNNALSVSDLQSGTYILKLVSNKGIFTQKVIKK